MCFRIYYADGTLRQGRTRDDWRRFPDRRVQVVCVFGPTSDPLPDRKETGYVHCPPWDRQMYTGVDYYDPYGWGVKQDSLITDRAYRKIWDRAVGDK